MSFREPLLLAALAVVPLGLVAYWLMQRRRQRYAVIYPAVDVLAGVAGRARGRHIPALLRLLAIAALAVALARPERTVAVEQRQGTVMLVHDTSGSMRATDVAPDRLAAAREAARTLATTLPEEFRLGLVSFGSTAQHLRAIRRRLGELLGGGAERDQAEPELLRQGVGERLRRLAGRAQPVRLHVGRAHRARGVVDEHDRALALLHRDRALRPRERDGERRDRQQAQQRGDVAPARLARDGREDVDGGVAHRVALPPPLGQPVEDQADRDDGERREQQRLAEAHRPPCASSICGMGTRSSTPSRTRSASTPAARAS